MNTKLGKKLEIYRYRFMNFSFCRDCDFFQDCALEVSLQGDIFVDASLFNRVAEKVFAK